MAKLLVMSRSPSLDQEPLLIADLAHPAEVVGQGEQDQRGNTTLSRTNSVTTILAKIRHRLKQTGGIYRHLKLC